MRAEDDNNINNIPDDALEALAMCMLPAIRSYFESEEGQHEFTKWKTLKDTENIPSREAKLDDDVRRVG